MVGGGEVVTLQIGRSASHAGAHFWNTQDEAAAVGDDCPAADILYRERGGNGNTSAWVPRLVAVEFKGQFGSIALSEAGRANLSVEDDQLAEREGIAEWWSCGSEVRREEEVPRSKFLQHLDELEEAFAEGQEEEEEEEEEEERKAKEANTKLSASAVELNGHVNYWTDYLKVDLCPSTIYELPLRTNGDTDLTGFGSGQELLRVAGSAGAQAYEEIGERVRRLVEECDRMQGMQMFVDDWGGYSGIGARVLSELRDDYNRAPIFLFGMRPPKNELDIFHGTPINALNEAMTIAKLYAESTVAIPLHLSSVSMTTAHYSFDAGQSYHQGALTAAAIDTMSLPYRSPPQLANANVMSPSDMRDYATLLTTGGVNIASVSCAFPAPLLPNVENIDASGVAESTDRRMARTSIDALLQGAEVSTVPLSGAQWHQTSDPSALIAEMSVMRGARMQNNGVAPFNHAMDSLYQIVSNRAHTNRKFAAFSSPFYIPATYPRVFNEKIGEAGERLGEAETRPEQKDVRSLSMLLHVTSTSSFGDTITGAAKLFSRAAVSASGRSILQSWDMDGEDAGEIRAVLNDMANLYRDAREHGSDDSDDDIDNY